MNTFTVGEKVVQQSSPYLPVLTILKINDNGTYHCQYHDDKHHEHFEDFAESSLKQYFDPATIIRF
jgi:uncharacterized protein YodC (DUF2158 family)